MPALFFLLAAPAAFAQLQDVPEDNDNFGYAVAAGDFDGDGYDDLASGIPNECLGSPFCFIEGGAVSVVYGAPGGLDSPGNQLWNQNSPGLGDSAGARENFGEALAVGDFDADGYDDLAIGSPGESRNGFDNVGQVHVLYGGPSGLTGSGSFYFPQLTVIHDGKRFGSALAAGDFDGDGRDDLAVGIRGQNIGSRTSAGAIAVFFGSNNGIKIGGYQVWHQDSPGIAGVAETGDLFGWALAAGNFDGDSRDDLAISAILEDIDGVSNAGVVHVLYGSGSGLTASGDQLWYQNSPGIGGGAETDDWFGYALTAGDYDGDGRDDLAIGVPYEDIGQVNAGAVNVIYGTASGLSAAGDQVWYQDAGGINDVSEAGDLFGFALASGDFNNNGRDDLAVGVPFEDVNGDSGAGAVNVIYGTSSIVGLSANGDEFWSQDTPGIAGGAEPFDRFGYALTTGHFGTLTPAAGLAAGVPFEGVSGATSAGAVNVIYGFSGSGLSTTWNHTVYQGLNLLVENPPVAKDGALEEEQVEETTEEIASSALPETVALHAAYPNPVRDRATLGFALPETADVRLAVYDLLGRTVAVLAEGTREAGEHTAAFDAAGLPSGTYLVRLEAGGTVETQRLTLVR